MLRGISLVLAAVLISIVSVAVSRLYIWQDASATHDDVKTAVIVGGGRCAFFGPNGDGCDARRATFVQPFGIALDRSGDLYISEKATGKVRKIKAGWDAVVNGHADDIVTTIASGLAGPDDLYIYRPKDELYVADSDNFRVLKITPGADGELDGPDDSDGDETTTTVAGVAGQQATGACGSGQATSTPLGEVESIFVDTAETLYIAYSIDGGLSFICKVVGGDLSPVAGRVCSPGEPSGDGGLATNACIWNIEGVVKDLGGNIYFTATPNGNGDGPLRKIDTGSIVTTVATIPAPYGLQVERGGQRVFIASYWFSVYRFDPATGSLAAVAGDPDMDLCLGSGPGSLNGVTLDSVPADPSPNALCMEQPYDVAIDISGDVYVADEDGAIWRLESLAAVCPDVNGDGLVTGFDYSEVNSHIGDSPWVDGPDPNPEGKPTKNWTLRRDLNRNHILDQGDVDMILAGPFNCRG